MKKTLSILLFFVFTISSANTYYVTPRGNDSNDGLDTASNKAWLTWHKAFQTANAGDTVYFRGGIYTGVTTTQQQSKNGTSEDKICFFNYNNELPILDCGNITTYRWGKQLEGVYITGNYIHLKGLVVRNRWQILAGDGVAGISFYLADNTIVQNCTSYDMGGSGYRISQCTNISFINCDAYNCSDLLGDPASPGNDGYGFETNNDALSTASIYFIGCRAWKCGDDGFACYDRGYVEFSGCWSFRNGWLDGNGSGFKLGFHYWETTDLTRKIYNCIAAYNRSAGIAFNDPSGTVAQHMEIYNNTIYKTISWDGYSSGSYGLWVMNSSSDQAQELLRITKNNISYANEDGDVYVAAEYTHSNNSWDASPAITITDADFISLDSTGLSGVRDAHGGLPNINYFLHLGETSDAIGAGVDVGLTLDGDSLAWSNPPSLGAYEFIPPDPPIEPTVVIESYNAWVKWATISSNVGSDGGGTVSARGVCWKTTTNPTTADSKTSDGSGTGVYISSVTGLLANTTYYLKAYATNEVGTAYSTEVIFITPKYTVLKSGGKVLVSGGKILVIQ